MTPQQVHHEPTIATLFPDSFVADLLEALMQDLEEELSDIENPEEIEMQTALHGYNKGELADRLDISREKVTYHNEKLDVLEELGVLNKDGKKYHLNPTNHITSLIYTLHTYNMSEVGR